MNLLKGDQNYIKQWKLKEDAYITWHWVNAGKSVLCYQDCWGAGVSCADGARQWTLSGLQLSNKWEFLEEMQYLISLNPLLLKNIAYIGSWKHFVFVFVCVCVSLSFCKYSSRSLSSPDDKLSENIWFVWSKTSYGGDKWRCHHGDGRTDGQPSEYSVTQSVDNVRLSFAICV